MDFLKELVELLKKSKSKLLTLGTPPEEEVLYKYVVKRKVPQETAEQMVLQDMKNGVKHLFDTNETVEVKQDTATPKPVEDSKKTGTKKALAKTSRTNTTQSKSTKKKTSPAKGSKKAAKMALYTKHIKKYYGEVDEAFLAIIVNNLGPSIYRKDAELVSCSDPKELSTVRRNFLIKKLGIDASQSVLDEAIQDVCQELKSSRTKYRATFYYALAKKFKKESVLS